MTRHLLAAVSLLGSTFACAPEIDVRSSRVEGPRVLSVVAEPPEARPGEAVTYTIWAATPQGLVENPLAEAWYCGEPAPFGSNNTVAAACARDDSMRVDAIAPGVFQGEIRSDACRVFGPDPPLGDVRPREPDSTGGYYQPLAVRFDGQVSFHLQRIQCNPGDVATDVARDFVERYAPNQNPAGVTLAHRLGHDASLQLGWGEEARELFAMIDGDRGIVVEQREGFRVDWFATGGRLDRDHDEVTPESRATNVTNELIMDAGAGAAQVFAVVHDGRRGTTVRHLILGR